MKGNRTWAFLLAFAVSAYFGYLFWYQRSRDPEVAARSALQAILDNDPDHYYSWRSHDEEKGTGLELAKFQKIWNDLIMPVRSRMPLEGTIESTKNNDPPSEGIAEVKMRLPNGGPFSWGLVVYATEDGPKHLVLYETLNMRWNALYREENPNEDPPNWSRAKVLGVQRDRAFMEGIGVTGVRLPNGVLCTWSDLERRFQWLSDEFERKNAPPQRTGQALDQ